MKLLICGERCVIDLDDICILHLGQPTTTEKQEGSILVLDVILKNIVKRQRILVKKEYAKSVKNKVDAYIKENEWTAKT